MNHLCLHPENFTATCAKTMLVMFPGFSDSLIVHREIVFQWKKEFEKYKGSTILLIGGGPSTKDTKWEKIIDEVDYIWSLNHFFLNERIYDFKVSLATVCPEVDLCGSDFRHYLGRYNPEIGFEINTPYMTSQAKTHFFELHEIASLFCMHTRFTSQLGGMVRLMVLAHFLGVAELYFVGLDGSVAILSGQHAFTPGKTTLPIKVNENNANEIFDQQYKTFWDYLLYTLQTNMRMYNLGEDMPYNMPAKYTKELFPLPQSIGELVT